MANADDRMHANLHDIVHSVTMQLIRSMDNDDDGWEKLAAEAQFTFDEICELQQQNKKVGGSATNALLWKLGCRGYTAKMLYEMLHRIERYHDAEIMATHILEGSRRNAHNMAISSCGNSEALNSLLSRINLSNVNNQQPVQGGHAIAYNSQHQGSEVNFNHASWTGALQAKVAGNTKIYEDKFIPGAVQVQSPPSSSQPYPSQPAIQSGRPTFYTSVSSSDNSAVGGASYQGDSTHLVHPAPGTHTPNFNSYQSQHHYQDQQHQQLQQHQHYPQQLQHQQHQQYQHSQQQYQHSQQHYHPPQHPQQRYQQPQQQYQYPQQQYQHPQQKYQHPQQQYQYPQQQYQHPQQQYHQQPQSSIQSEAEMAISVKTSFSYEEVHSATDRFSAKNVIGEGGFGTVYHGFLRSFDCAVKRFKKAQENKEQINSELAALLKYQHENIVTLYGYTLDGPELCLVYQYLKNGSLEDRLMRKNDTPVLSWERRLNIMFGSCEAVSFLHSFGQQPLIHGDIKSANILLDDHLQAKFADLGQSRYATSRSTNTGGMTHITVQESTSQQFGSRAYQAPEIKTGCRLSIQSDIYALGVVLLEICSGLIAFDYNRNDNKFLTDYYTHHISDLSDSDQVDWFCDKRPTDSISPSAFMSLLALAKQCITDAKKRRPSCKKLRGEIKTIYSQLCAEPQQGQGPRHHQRLNSPTEDELLDASEQSYYYSHYSERALPNDCHSPAPQSTCSPNSSHHKPSFLQIQDDLYQKISSQNQSKTSPSNQNSLTNPSSTEQVDSKTFLASSQFHNGCRSTPEQKLSNTSISPASQDTSCLTQEQPSFVASFPPGQPPPEAYQLQDYYDHRSMSGQLHSQEPFVTSNPQSNPAEEESEEKLDLRSDPQKMSVMNHFDQLGFTVSYSEDVSEGVQEQNSHGEVLPLPSQCDEAKIALMNKFDDSLYSERKANTGQCSVSITHQQNESIPVDSHGSDDAHSKGLVGNNRVERDVVCNSECSTGVEGCLTTTKASTQPNGLCLSGSGDGEEGDIGKVSGEEKLLEALYSQHEGNSVSDIGGGGVHGYERDLVVTAPIVTIAGAGEGRVAENVLLKNDIQQRMMNRENLFAGYEMEMAANDVTSFDDATVEEEDDDRVRVLV